MGEVQSPPDSTGVYLMKDNAGRIIYIGKALSLKNRVASYFNRSYSPDLKTSILVENISNIDYIITGSEEEALVLESTLIKIHKPKFNIRLKDDKNWLYLKVTSEEWPKIVLTREMEEDGARYFGPYTEAGLARKTLDIVRRVFPVRSCKREIDKKRTRPCLYFQIKMCRAPCNLDVKKQEYDDLVKGALMFLGGHHRDLVRRLEERMENASLRMNFERAAAIRDQLKSIRKSRIGHVAVPSSRHDQDVIGIGVQKDLGCAQVFFVRDKRIVGRKRFYLDGVKDTPVEEVISSFLMQYYSSTQDVPKEVIVQVYPLDKVAILNWLSGRRKSRVELKVPLRGRKRKLLLMAVKNAEFELGQQLIKEDLKKVKDRAVSDLQKELRLSSPPLSIEAVDISNIGGKNAVGSLVVFKEGKPSKKDYRRFKIKSVGPDDVGMIKEVVLRRYNKVNTPPDLLLVDGGKGQVNAAVDVLKGLELDDFPVIGLAKEHEHIFFPGRRSPLVLPLDSEALKLLMRIRDEAHRFAVSYHQKLRKKSLKGSILDDIPGVGEKRKRLMLERFGSVEEIKKASLEDLMEVPRMTKSAAVAVYNFLHNKGVESS